MGFQIVGGTQNASSTCEKLLMFFQQQFIFTLLDTQITFGLNINQLNCEV